MKRKVLYINHKKSQCGVYEFGKNIGLALTRSSFGFSYHECDSTQELAALVDRETPDLIIYNYHPSTMDWLGVDFTRRIKCPQIGTIHEVTQKVADAADNKLFNFHIAADPTLLLKNPIVFKVGRLIPRYEKKFDLPSTPTIGSFGFAGNKGHRRIIELVEKEFDVAVVRFSIPFSTFIDADGAVAKAIAEDCRNAVSKPGIRLELSHAFLEQPQLLDYLAQNTINLFLYENMDGERGVSATADVALAVRRPIGITRQKMFRHLLGATPSICVEDSSIKGIIAQGIEPLEPFYEEWSDEVICWDYERIAADVLTRSHIPEIVGVEEEKPKISLIRRVRGKLGIAKRYLKKRLGNPNPIHRAWISDTSIKSTLTAPPKGVVYVPAVIPEDWHQNNTLNNEARRLFQGTIQQMENLLPDLMKRKIPEANVQQAFVLDSVFKIVSRIERPRILCVGSFEDSAADSLKLLGFKVQEVDPMVNYDLNTFMTKPTTRENSFDVVFSTSVIEHVEDDEKFMMQIASLLRKDGIAVLTADYCDTYKAGDPKPLADFRLYTQKDFNERLLPKLTDCELVDEPQWDCPNPDFRYEGIDYTFSTLVLKKVN